MSVKSAIASSTEQPKTSPPWAVAATPRTSDLSLGAQLRRCPIVVAVSGEPQGAAPVRVASALQHRFGSRVYAVRVMDISDLPPSPQRSMAHADPPDGIEAALVAEYARATRQQIGDWLGAPAEWPVHVPGGAAAHEIARFADAQGAALIAMGLRRHGNLPQALRDEATLTVARYAQAAVLAVAPTLQILPRRAIVGVDFGPATIDAARAALDVLARPALDDPVTLRLVYVDHGRDEGEAAYSIGEGLLRRLGVDAAFERLVREIEAPPGIHVECAVRRGAPGAELLACADQSGATLIAMGSLRHERPEQSLLGTVTTEVVRDGRCSVLIVPPSTQTLSGRWS